MDTTSFAHQGIPRYPQHPHQPLHQHHNQPHQPHPPANGAFYPSTIDVDALAAGVQRYLPGRTPATVGYPHNNSSYIHLPPGVDPATVDFRTFYPYNPSEVKHRKRTTRPQLKVLEETFKRETKPNAALRKQLAAQLEMTPRGVQVWFQNRRAKEKNLAKKASSSNANGKKSINQDSQKSDGSACNSNIDVIDGDADLDDDGDVAASASGAAEDDTRSNCEKPARPASQAPGTAASALNDRKRSHSSSNSPESTSTELTPPSSSGDISTHVDASPPTEDERCSRQLDTKQGVDASGLGFPPSSWQGPPRSMSRTPTSVVSMDQGHEYPGEMGYEHDLNMMPMHDQFMRRTSLPTHIGIGPSRVRSAYHGSPRLPTVPFGGLGAAGRMPGFDPTVRRMSLDRLASHPYAHVAAQANSVVYGSSLSRYRPTLPATTHSTPTLTPQARTADLPPVNQTQIENGNDTSNGIGDASSNASGGMPELLLPSHMHHHPSMSPPAPEVRPEFMHRQSLPVTPGQFPQNSTATDYPPPPQSANATSMRFPRQGHVYALSTRNYQPPIPGPLPNPDFSFGSVGNGEGEGSSGDCSSTPDTQLQSQLNNFQFPTMDDGKDNNGSSAPNANGMDMEMGDDPHTTLPPGSLGSRSNLYYRDTQGIHGTADPYASRFGSIASTVSIAESESSVTSGACFSSESASNLEIQQDLTNGYSDVRRASCTGSMMDMFSNMDMRNNSQSSLPHPLESQKQQEQHPHQLQQHRQSRPHQVPISGSSELALALVSEDDNESVYGGDNGSSVNVSVNETNDAGIYARASMSSSDLSHSHLRAHGHVYGQGHRHPLATSSQSAASSRSSLGFPPRPPRIETEKLDFIHNFDAVSETGHYSPVSHPRSPAPFEYPLTEPVNGGVHSAHGSAASLHEPESSGMMSRTPPHQYGVAEQQQQSQYYGTSGPFARDASYVQPQPSPSYPLHGHSQESLSGYGYYN